VDQGTPGFDAGDPSNTTIDRIYTGMIRVVKEARVLEDDGVKELVPFTTDTAKLAQAAEPNRFVEYRLTYTNVSAGGGTNSVILPATDFVIVDDGALAPNNWFSTTLDPAFPTVSNGTATSSFGQITVTTANLNDPPNPLKKGEPDSKSPFLRGMHGGSPRSNDWLIRYQYPALNFTCETKRHEKTIRSNSPNWLGPGAHQWIALSNPSHRQNRRSRPSHSAPRGQADT
jgi:hypothetical protein